MLAKGHMKHWVNCHMRRDFQPHNISAHMFNNGKGTKPTRHKLLVGTSAEVLSVQQYLLTRVEVLINFAHVVSGGLSLLCGFNSHLSLFERGADDFGSLGGHGDICREF